jgi:excinuclease ABC subunit C
MLESVLDEVPQLGQARRKALLERYGSVAAIRKASAEDIAATPGIGEKIAELIVVQLGLMSTQKIDMQTGEIVETNS